MKRGTINREGKQKINSTIHTMEYYSVTKRMTC